MSKKKTSPKAAVAILAAERALFELRLLLVHLPTFVVGASHDERVALADRCRALTLALETVFDKQ